MKSIRFGEQPRHRTSTVTFANPDVLAFYKTLPFNFRVSVAKSAEAIQSQDPCLAYPILKPLLNSHTRVLDVGCGNGVLLRRLLEHLPTL